MSSLEVEFCGLKSKNPFWLACSPVSNSGEMIGRAFAAGWGGAVYKTIGVEDTPGVPASLNVTPRLSALRVDGRVAGMENIELITGRMLADNLRDITQLKRDYPDHVLFVSIMALPVQRDWQTLARLAEEAGADGIELNLSCPHGSMRGKRAGSAVGQDPETAAEVTGWVRAATRLPIMAKLPAELPNSPVVAHAVKDAGADALATINTVPCIIGVDLDTLSPMPSVYGLSTTGGYSGPAIKPIGLKKISDLALDPTLGLPLSGIGGISTWRDAIEFVLLGATTVQVCTAAMHYGYRIVEGMIDGMTAWLDEKGYATLDECRGLALPKVKHGHELDRDHKSVATINPDMCIRDDLCYLACQDGGHQAITLDGERVPSVDESKCQGCGLCAVVCPVPGCVGMRLPGKK